MPNTPKKIEEELKELKKRVAELEQGESAQYYLAGLSNLRTMRLSAKPSTAS